MGRCVIVNCKHRNRNGPHTKVFSFPKDLQRAKLWLSLAGLRPNRKLRYAKICKYHFLEEEIEHTLSCRLLDKSYQKMEYCKCPLREDANPSINVPGLTKEQTEKKREREKRIKKRENKKIVEDLLKNAIEYDSDGVPVKPLPFEYVSTRTALPGESLQVFSDSEEEVEIKVESPSSAVDITENELSDETNFQFVYEKNEPDVFEEPQEMETEEDDLSQLCRLCALPGGDMVEIFGTDGLGDKINLCLPLKVSESDSLPLQVCRSCLSGVEQSHRLATTCLSAQETLNNIWQQKQQRQLQRNQRLQPNVLYSMSTGMDNMESVRDLTSSSSLAVSVEFQAPVLSKPSTSALNLPERSTTKPQSRIPPLITNVDSTAKQPQRNVAGPSTSNNVPPATPQIQMFPNSSKVQCHVCKTGLMTAADAQSHCLNTHGRFLCEYCFKIFTDEENLSFHLNLDHKFICSDCGFVAVGQNRKILENHQQIVHGNHEPTIIRNKKIYFCMKCKNRYQTESEFVNHVKNSCLVVLETKEKNENVVNVKKRVNILTRTEKSKIAVDSKEEDNVNSRDENEAVVVSKKKAKVNELNSKSKGQNKVDVDLKKKINVNFQKAKAKRKNAHVELKDITGTPISDYDCRICYRFLATKHNLKGHYSRIHSVNLCHDEQCSEYFDTEEQLNEHCISVHQKTLTEYKIPADIVCDKCGKTFKILSSFKNHVYYDHLHGEGKYPCTQCDKKYRTSTKLKRHLTRHTGKKDCVCHVCGKMFYDTVRLAFHSEIHKPKRHTCPICDKKFSCKRNLNTHKNAVHDKQWIFNCNVCNDKYTNEDDVLQHYETHTEEERAIKKAADLFTKTSPFQCSICFKYSPNRLRLKGHLELTHNLIVKNLPKYPGDNSIPEVIQKTIKNSSTSAQTSKTGGIFKCDVCSKQLANKISLSRHITTHMETKPFQCKYCSQSFTMKVSLVTHTRLHTNERPFKCNICDKGFTSKNNLKFHVDRVHHDIRKYCCKICPKRFHQFHHLQCHIRVHTNERPYSCDICQQKFKQVGDMRRHVAKHNL